MSAILSDLEREQPPLSLVGGDGNAFAIIGKVSRAVRDFARGTDYDAREIRAAEKDIVDDMTSGDYDHLLRVAMRYFNVN